MWGDSTRKINKKKEKERVKEVQKKKIATREKNNKKISGVREKK